MSPEEVDDDLTHYMNATTRMRQRAERAEAALEAEKGANREHAVASARIINELGVERDRLRAAVDRALAAAHEFEEDAQIALVTVIEHLDGATKPVPPPSMVEPLGVQDLARRTMAALETFCLAGGLDADRVRAILSLTVLEEGAAPSVTLSAGYEDAKELVAAMTAHLSQTMTMTGAELPAPRGRVL